MRTSCSAPNFVERYGNGVYWQKVPKKPIIVAAQRVCLMIGIRFVHAPSIV
jgi:hypothetical protein